MRCSFCNADFEERFIHESHDVPCYLFPGKDRATKKGQADKFGRRWLCLSCHDAYENKLRIMFIKSAELFAQHYFKKEGEKDG